MSLEKLKVCSVCRDEKSVEEFNKNKCKTDGLQTSCKPCNAKRSAAYYERNKEEHKITTGIRRKANRNRNRQYVWDYLSAHPCVDCSEADPIVLEFDHVSGVKKCAVSQLVAHHEASLDTIYEEIQKCEVRCANCHRRKTFHQFNWYKDIDTGL